MQARDWNSTERNGNGVQAGMGGAGMDWNPLANKIHAKRGLSLGLARLTIINILIITVTVVIITTILLLII